MTEINLEHLHYFGIQVYEGPDGKLYVEAGDAARVIEELMAMAPFVNVELEDIPDIPEEH